MKSGDFEELLSREGQSVVEQPVQAVQAGHLMAVVLTATERVSCEGCVSLCEMLRREYPDSEHVLMLIIVQSSHLPLHHCP